MTHNLNEINFKVYEPVISILSSMPVEAKVLSVVEDGMISHTTSHENYKFSVGEKYARQVDMYKMTLICLIKGYGLSRDLFSGGGAVTKQGCISFDNSENKTAVRIWTTKKVGKNIIFEVSVVGYKGAVPEPIKK
jgi:hypothetical protein